MNYIGQIFGNREVVSDNCTDEDWESLGLKIPLRPDKYKLTRCLNCGSVLPCELGNLRKQPPKRCVFCSNIGNHSKVQTLTNTWTAYNDYAVCNVLYNGEIVSFYVDICDYETMRAYTWRISKKRQKYYVVSGSAKKGTMRYLHDAVYGAHDKNLEIDHIDGNSLNNRHANLRLVDRQTNVDNQRATRIDNQIGIRGIVYNKTNKTYKVDFQYHGARYYTKDWKTIEEAVWCRLCLEEHFDIPAIKSNPLAEQYFTLDNETRDKIRQYVQKQILGNERYESLHAHKQLSEDSKGRI